ncbi:MerR family transcriptional regulator [uncultured Lactobacillus sp.]|uniref:MerR family transcriptional regulator n=1 Tax=uncultured Lactobacillus sp. TaxID=153152 RepID=UPI0028058E04|nr:MerR family transcriptional regulator [uncultured Lactobacillus sp.]
MNGSQNELTSKEVADFFGISKDTLRFYEEKGIIPHVPRDKNGYRVYTDYELNWIYLAMNLKRAGLSLDAIAEFGYLFNHPSEESFKKQKDLLSDQIDAINRQIKILQDTKNVLQYKLDIFDDHFVNLEQGNIDHRNVEPIWKKYQK